MGIDIKLLKECSVLTERERELLLRVGVNGEKLSDVARSLDLHKSTVSTQLRRGREKLIEWIQNREEKNKTSIKEAFSKRAFRMFNKGMPPNKVAEILGDVEGVAKLWKLYHMLAEDDYSMALRKVAEYGFEPDKSSKHPLSDQVSTIIEEHYWLRDDKKLVWKYLRDNLYGINEYAHGSTRDAVKRVIDHLNEKWGVKKGLESLLH